MQSGRIMRSGCYVMVTHDTTSGQGCFLRGAEAMSVDLSKFGIISGKKYGELLDDPVCVCGFEKALSAGQLIDFGDRFVR